MRRNDAVKACFGLILLLVSTVSAAQGAMTTREKRALSAPAANRSAQHDLLSILEPIKRIQSGMYRQLRGTSFVTRSFGTSFRGLCQRDVIEISYAPAQPDDTSEDAPVYPYSVATKTEFRVVKLRPPVGDEEDRRPDVWQAECRGAGADENANWFTASDDRTAIQGALVLEAAINAVRAGTLKFESCYYMSNVDKRSCEAAIIANSDLSSLNGVETCPSNSENMCYVIEAGSSIKLTIQARRKTGSLEPETIISITTEEEVIVT